MLIVYNVQEMNLFVQSFQLRPYALLKDCGGSVNFGCTVLGQNCDGTSGL